MHAVRMVFALREELGISVGTVTRVARQSGYGEESLRRLLVASDFARLTNHPAPHVYAQAPISCAAVRPRPT